MTTPPATPPDGKLLPCPFCGTEPYLFTRKLHDSPDSDRALFWYVCKMDGCGVGVTRGEWHELAARHKWNNRNADAMLAARKEARDE